MAAWLCVQGLTDLGYEVVSTGGSATAIEAAGVPVKRVEELTGFPEMLDGELVAVCSCSAMDRRVIHAESPSKTIAARCPAGRCPCRMQAA